jgi:hypothetical protein
MNKKIKIILIIAAALIVVAAAVFVVYKLTKRNKADEANITLFKCHMAKEITDSDLADIKKIIEAAVPGKYIDIAKGSIPYKESLTGEDEEEIYLGDSVTVTLSVLTEEEKVAVFSAVAKEYGISGGHLVEIKDIYRNE